MPSLDRRSLLFIGGHAAGKVYDVPDTMHHFTVPIYRGIDRTQKYYRREAIHFSSTEKIEFMVLDKWSPQEAFQHLLDSYKEAHAKPR